MRLIITNVEKKDDHIYVTGETAVGNIKGKWCGRESPISGGTYFFELSIDELDRNEISVINDKIFWPSVNFSGNKVRFEGICEEIDDVYVVRFSYDWIEMLSIKNDDFSIKRGDAISLSINYDLIGIYPY